MVPVLGMFKYVNPVWWIRKFKETGIATKDIARMKSRDRYYFIFVAWVIFRMTQKYKIPDSFYIELMKEFELCPDDIVKDWDADKFGFPEMGYTLVSEKESQTG